MKVVKRVFFIALKIFELCQVSSYAATGAVTPNNALIVTSTLNASRPTGTSMITPGAVVGTLINAGVGYATAGAVGKALGAMNLISPAGQQTLRNVGMWGGMINGIGNAILH